MTTRQFKRTLYCMGVMGLWLALATPAFAAKTITVDLGPATSSAAVSVSVGTLVVLEQ